MSDKDVMQDKNIEEEFEAAEKATIEADEVEAEEAVAAESEETEDDDSEYEIVEQEPEPSPDAKRNKAFAKQRIEAKEAKRKADELERRLEAVQRGEIPEELKEQLSVAPELPDQPSYEDFFSDKALEKYGYDTTKAQAAFMAAQQKWLYDAQNARTVSQTNEVKRRQQFIESEQARVKAVKAVVKSAAEIGIKDFDSAEDALNAVIPNGSVIVAGMFGDDSREAAAVVNYLGKNPDEAKRIQSLPPEQAQREVYSLGYRKLQIRKKQKAKPEADTALEGGSPVGSTNTGIAQLRKAFDTMSTTEFRQKKIELERSLGRKISVSEYS